MGMGESKMRLNIFNYNIDYKTNISSIPL